MREHLQPWYEKWLDEHKSTDLIYVNRNSRNEPSLAQVHFVRDTLGHVMWKDIPYDTRPIAHPRECKESAWVIGEHRSKSVRLPVYSLERPDLGIRFVLRDNYHDWCVSVVAEKPIATDLRGFQLDMDEDDRKRYQPGGFWGYCFFQGFPSELCFGSFAMDPRRFSLSIGGNHALYTFIWLIMRDLRSKSSP